MRVLSSGDSIAPPEWLSTFADQRNIWRHLTGEMIMDTAPVRQGEELNAELLVKYLREHLSDLAIPPDTAIQVEQFPGGHSNLTYLIRMDGQEFVLRRPPLGPVAPTAHDMPREYRMLSAIHPVFPLAPKPYLLCEDAAIIGAPFYLMQRRRGIIIRRELPPELSDDLSLRRRISESMVDTLAQLHSIDLARHGLDKLGKPAGFVERQVRGWTERWKRAKTSDLPMLEEVIRWLTDNLPPDAERPTLLHNDYKLDNVVLDQNNPANIVAVLDWEMCATGDPLIDLGILLCYWSQADDSMARQSAVSSPTALPGWMTRTEIIERYARRTGRDVSAVAFYETFAIFKLAVVVQQIYFRWHQGQTQDKRFARFDRVVEGLAEAAYNLTRGSDIGLWCFNEAGRLRDQV